MAQSNMFKLAIQQKSTAAITFYIARINDNHFTNYQDLKKKK